MRSILSAVFTSHAHHVLPLLLAGICLCLCSCGKTPETLPRITCIRDLNNPAYRIGGMTGIIATQAAKEKLPKAVLQEYSMPIDAFTAICTGKVHAVVLDRPTLEYMALAHPELSVMEEDLAVGHISVAAARRSGVLMAQVNDFIRKYRNDGTYRQMTDRWFHSRNPDMPVIPLSGGPVLKIGVTANNEPLCFIRDCAFAGFDAEFSLRLGAYLKRRIEFRDMPYDALVAGLESGKIDLAVAFMDAVPEREESVLFSENYVDAPVTILIRNDSSGSASSGGIGACLHSLKESFCRTFIRENRWLLILHGLSVTLVITFFSVILGTLLAVPVCMMSRSGTRILPWLAERYVSLIMGTPILVILMLLYYVVFAKVDVSEIFVAVLAFALDFAAYASVMLRAGISGVPRGQTEAALALGHTQSAAFFRFVLPQAVRTILPVYRGQVVSTLKATSVVGYIAIMDLTKMGDIIRSRTYEAFFPLIAIAVIYFLAAKALNALLMTAEKKLDPENRRRVLLQKQGGRR